MFNFESFYQNLGVGILLVVIWEAFWKAIGLWKSAKAGNKLWFVAIFLINFFGIVPIFYLWRSKQLENSINDTLKFLRLKK